MRSVPASIIIVHGAFEHIGRYNHLIKQFEADGYRVFGQDLPAQGNSEGIKGHIRSFDQYIERIGEWLKQIDEGPVFLLGHSMGGLAVIRTMQELKPKVNGVILSSPAMGILNGASKPMEAASKILNYLWPSLKVDNQFNPENVTRSEAVRIRDHYDQLILKKVSIRWYKEFQKGIRQAFLKVNQFPEVPILVMQAGEDLMVDVRKTKEWFHKIDLHEKTYKEWPGLYHELFNEPEWKQVYTFTTQFIQQQLLKPLR
ncbi:alpha/beta hydrolase [Halobacillus shinanisalinarum]|uniref:Alpha/beta hydrolase n=1 Tax=Halobacillus shinanisalinarum TaxID=2932258 RepID=A0ABY4H171_9BACI|nr:alpha/beta hydrolase [Halobacillus shinanisalinarum]UOQ94195.1 alpha/beta hydrolase [Halobacillus shinanisalinarum]